MNDIVSVDILFYFFRFLYPRCECGMSQQMPTIHESVCYREIGQIGQKVEHPRPETQMSCVTEQPGFQWNCLDVWVLETIAQRIIQHASMFTMCVYTVTLLSFNPVKEISLHCLQTTRMLMLGLSWQECGGLHFHPVQSTRFVAHSLPPEFGYSYTGLQSHQTSFFQKRLVFEHCTYKGRQEITECIFNNIVNSKSHKLHWLLPEFHAISYNLRHTRRLIQPNCKTKL